jgi:dihydroxyacetone kinase
LCTFENFKFAISQHKKNIFISQHGEPGVAVVDLQPVDVVVEHVLKQIFSQVNFLSVNFYFNVFPHSLKRMQILIYLDCTAVDIL